MKWRCFLLCTQYFFSGVLVRKEDNERREHFDSLVKGLTNFAAELFKVALALSPLSLLDTVSKFAAGEFVPEPFDGGEVRIGNVLDIGKVHKVAALFFGSRNFNQRITSELWLNRRKEDGHEGRQA